MMFNINNRPEAFFVPGCLFLLLSPHLRNCSFWHFHVGFIFQRTAGDSSCVSADNIWTDQNLLLDPDLPSGWRTIKDSTGTYYWHVPTGATQWQHPALSRTPQALDTQQEEAGSQPTSRQTVEPPEDRSSWHEDYLTNHDPDSKCFAVRSLGWLQVEEEDLSPGRSSLAVSNVIQQLSHCNSPEQRDRMGAWGEVRHLLYLSVCQYVYLSVCVSVCLPVCLCVSMSTCLCVSMFTCLSVCQYVYLSVCVSVCLPVCLCVSMSTCLCVSMSTCLSVCQYVYLSVCVSVCLPVCVSVCLPVCLCVSMSTCLSVCQYVYLSVCVSVCLPVCLCVSMFTCLCVSMSTCLCVSMSTCLSVCQYVYLSVCQYVYLS
ncbi:uncharacterized protein, partial [Thunnus thynnus]|uniref:uncharacterized protein n=1 Tax=Thunnus thynnus TaxID=8237 RepID=UPI00352909A7